MPSPIHSAWPRNPMGVSSLNPPQKKLALALPRRHRASTLLRICAAFGVTSFAAGARAESPLASTTSPSVSASAFSTPAAQKPEATESSQPSSLLRDLVTRAATRSPEVRNAAAALLASQSARTAGNLSPFLNPQLEVRAQRSTRGAVKDVAIEGSVWLPFEFLGQGSARRTEAERYIVLYQKALALAQTQATGRVVRSFGGLSVATLRKHVLSELAANAAAEVELYEARLKAGDSIALDVATSKLEAALHSSLLHEAGADVVRHGADLQRLTGRHITLETSSVELPPLPLRQVPLAAAAQVSEAEAQFHSATRERARADARGALSLGVIGGRGDIGEARYGLGVGYALPVFRTNQVEQARADADRTRAETESRLRREEAAWSIQSAAAQLVELRTSLETLVTQALPAAEAALKAAQETHAAGKSEWLVVLVARRDLSSLRLRHLNLLDRGWDLIAQIVEHTGELP